jgi:hypothetical protein
VESNVVSLTIISCTIIVQCVFMLDERSSKDRLAAKNSKETFAFVQTRIKKSSSLVLHVCVYITPSREREARERLERG